VGCGATGLAWVDQPESASGWSGSEERSVANVPVRPRASKPIPAAADAEPAPENHPRLNHTITLGEVDATAPAEQAPGPYGPPVSVTINNYGQTGGAAPGYAGYGYAGGFARGGNFNRSGVTGASRASSGGMQPGQNWPGVADHGPSFPFRSAPASPWTRAGRSQ
jgi:hypothetical protein